MKKTKLSNKDVKKLKMYMLSLRWDAIRKNTKADNILNELSKLKPNWYFTAADYARFFKSRGIKPAQR